jgi:2-succinyl-5-enolpyruvyl-6-hydroxy-3-cyclohexene-1-carboxylate synthase
LQPIYNIAEICSQHGIKEVILSPGSRCAPLTLAFVRHPEIRTRTISDERSAAFIAMGIALQTQNAVALVCTSGSAAYNYAPAVAEAFYQQIPLLILTADRPPEWIDQLDGQTIRQDNIYGKHVKANFSLPVDLSHQDAKWHSERIVSEAINIAQAMPCGPVHINIPLREPFYPTDADPVKYNKDVKVIKTIASQNMISEADWKLLTEEFSQSKKILLVAGQSAYNENFIQQIGDLSFNLKAPVVTDIISNIHSAKGTIKNHDTILTDLNSAVIKDLQPELLITFGNSVISKSLKSFLRKFKARHHWHIQPGAVAPDTFQSLSRVIQFDDPAIFLNELSRRSKSKPDNYFNAWKHHELQCADKIQKFFSSENSFSEFEAINTVINNLPDNSILHWDQRRKKNTSLLQQRNKRY